MKNFWNAKDYSQFLDERTRPARDLLSEIPDRFVPHEVIDLGCGPGNSTVLLKQRWPNAHVVGIDSSQDMLALAQKTYPDIEFMHGDIQAFNQTADCIFANASLQWCDHHPVLFKKLLESLNDGGFLAIQMPNNFHMPAHQALIEILSCDAKWEKYLKNLRYGKLTRPLYSVAEYYDILSAAKHIQLWETDYYMEMQTHADIFEWGKGTGLKPILSIMDSQNQALFQEKFIEAITPKFHTQANKKILFPFKRMFMVAMK